MRLVVYLSVRLSVAVVVLRVVWPKSPVLKRPMCDHRVVGVPAPLMGRVGDASSVLALLLSAVFLVACDGSALAVQSVGVRGRSVALSRVGAGLTRFVRVRFVFRVMAGVVPKPVFLDLLDHRASWVVRVSAYRDKGDLRRVPPSLTLVVVLALVVMVVRLAVLPDQVTRQRPAADAPQFQTVHVPPK